MPAAAPSPEPACTWIGHCLGDQCQTQNDCDQSTILKTFSLACLLIGRSSALDWICVSSRCAIPPSSSPHTLSKAEIAGISAGVPIFVALVGGVIVLWMGNRRRKRRQKSVQGDYEKREDEPPAYPEGGPALQLNSVRIKAPTSAEIGHSEAPIELGPMERDFGELEGEPQYLPYLPPVNKDSAEQREDWMPRPSPPVGGVLTWKEADIGLRNWQACTSENEDAVPSAPPRVPINSFATVSGSAPSIGLPNADRTSMDEQERERLSGLPEPQQQEDIAMDDEITFREGEPYVLFSWPPIKPHSRQQNDH
jgi:hypothetical protein